MRARSMESIKVVVKKSKQKTQAGGYRRRQENNIKMTLKETLCDVNWIKLTSDKPSSNVTVN
jgi:hypothetical protein